MNSLKGGHSLTIHESKSRCKREGAERKRIMSSAGREGAWKSGKVDGRRQLRVCQYLNVFILLE